MAHINDKSQSEHTVDDDDESSISSVETNGNSIWFYSDINNESSLKFSASLVKAEKSSVIAQIEFGLKQPPPIKLFINSPGGGVYDSLMIANKIQSSKIPVHTIVDGYAASGASIISVSGGRRFMHKNSTILIHQLSSWFGGKFEELKDDMENATKLMTMIVDHYMQNTKLPKRELEKLLKRDLLLTSDQCLKFGFVDEII